MLSRHLYRIDEVKASCYYALIHRNYKEALFWSMELCDTVLSADLLDLLLRAWFYGGGSYRLLIDLVGLMNQEEITVEEILPFVGGICNSENDASVLYLLAMGAADWATQPDTFVKGTVQGTAQGTAQGTEPCVVAMKQRKALFAWTLLRCRWDENGGAKAWGILHELARDVETQTALKILEDRTDLVWEARAAAVLLICGKGSFTTPNYYLDQPLFTRWTELEGRRKRRELAIRPEACGSDTVRGSMPSTTTNIAEIREPLTALHGSPYWDIIAEEFGGWKSIYKNDESREAFFDLYFPDDIPDEWSAADQEKSHGCGFAVGASSETEHLRNLYGESPSLGLLSWTLDAVAQGLRLERYAANQAVWSLLQAGWDLSPRIKKIVLIK